MNDKLKLSLGKCYHVYSHNCKWNFVIMHFNNYNYTLITCANYPYRISMFLNYTLQTNKISGTQTTRRTLTLTNGKQEKLNDWYFIDWKNGTIFLSKGDHMNMNVVSRVRNHNLNLGASYTFVGLQLLQTTKFPKTSC